ncbi:MAG TPA: GyrI-like domain-containing protein [Rhizobacter sp.]
MKTLQTTEPMLVLGLPLRTRNDRAFQDIPAHWARFSGENWLARIPHRADGDVYAVYAHHEHEGVDNHGDYTLIIGARVTEASEVPEGLASVVIPPAKHAVFEVERGRHDKVGQRWLDVWANQDLVKTHRCDHERYAPDGNIEIRVGIR